MVSSSPFLLSNSFFTPFLSSAVQMGYYLDAYVPILAKASITASQKSGLPETRVPLSSEASVSTGWQLNEAPSIGRSALHIMPPLINRGYYARVSAIRGLLKSFFSTHNGAQVVSLGAGFDSTYFVLKVRSGFCVCPRWKLWRAALCPDWSFDVYDL